MKKMLINILFTIIVSCKQTELSIISFHATGQDTGQTNFPLRIKVKNQTTEDLKIEQEKKKLSCLRYCADINQFEKIEKDQFAYLGFTNFGYRGVGRCRGHALLTQKMNFLASFNPQGGCDLDELECVNQYRDGISKIKSFQKYEFNGFKNLYEFSSHPKIAPILRGIVAGTSNRYSAGFPHIENTSYESEILNHYYEIKRRVSLAQMPYVGVVGNITGSHGLLPYKEAFLGSRSILCVKDPNVSTGSIEVCENYFYEEEGEIFYQRDGKEADKMLKLSLTGDEDERMTKYHLALDNECITESRKQSLCK